MAGNGNRQRNRTAEKQSSRPAAGDDNCGCGKVQLGVQMIAVSAEPIPAASNYW